MRGPVVRGHQRGRTIGVPTANLRLTDQLVPADGVYTGQVRVDGRVWPAAVSIGRLETFGDSQRQIEAHLVGYGGDLYGRELDLEVLDWLRDQVRFAGVEALKAQIGRDIAEVLQRASRPPCRPIAAA
jgi:riboflavin kinase/FMN adenylyltransferase